MTPLPEQLSSVRKLQFEAQLDIFRALSNQALQSAQQVFTLNINTTRATVERSSSAVMQLFSVTDPRDLLAFGVRPQEEFQNMLSYGRELFSIATGARMTPARQGGVAWLPAPAAAPWPTVAAPSAPAPQVSAEQVARTGTSPEAATEPELAAEPVAKAKPIAKAISKAAPKPASAEHPLASAVPLTPQQEVDLSSIKPVEAAPPPPPVSGTPVIDVKQAEGTTGKGSRKK
jgi:phasin family protein